MSQSASRYADVYRELLGRTPEHRPEPSLDRVRAACRLLGDPQRSSPVVHLTGTNGKTTTARMVEALLREHGLRTGRFTSPHLAEVRERIALDGEPVSPEVFVAAYDDVLPFLRHVDAESDAEGGPAMTFFEALVVMAFATFADSPVDATVLEVGMAGRWDATNVADASVAVLTPIALDHEAYLGHDVLGIAQEKAGIIKSGCTTVLARQDPDVADLVSRRAAEVGASLVVEDGDFGVVEREVALGGQLVTLRGLAGEYREIYLPLHGAHQTHNAACALAAAEAFLGGGSHSLDGAVVEAAFAGATSPGRLEVVRRSPTVVVDAAHNPAGAAALAAALEDAFGFRRLVGVIGMMGDKDSAGILSALEPVLDEVVLTRAAGMARAASPDDLAEVARDLWDDEHVHVVERLDQAIERAVALAEAEGDGRAGAGTGVLVAGSIPLVGQARTLLGVHTA